MPFDKQELMKCAEQNSHLFSAILTHSQFNQANPSATPKPLFFTADFVRRTYLEYILPLLPREAIIKSTKLANRNLFSYGQSGPPFPTSDNEEWLNDNSNWPADRSSRQDQERFSDVVSRTIMIALITTDPVKAR